MRYIVSVFLGACTYGVLSTIVKKSYDHGFHLGEVVGSQLLTGALLSWALYGVLRWMKARPQAAARRGGSVSALPAEQCGRPHAGGQPQAHGTQAQARGLQPQDNRRKPQGDAAAYRLTWRNRLTLMLAGTPTAITGLLYYGSLQYIHASFAILLLFQFTWIGVLIESVASRKLPERGKLLSLLVLVAGTVLAAGVLGDGFSGLSVTGVVLGLLAAVSYTLFVIFSGKAVPQAEPTVRSAWMVTGGMLLVFLLFPPVFLVNGALLHGLLLFGFLLGLLGAFIPPILFAIGVPHIGPGLAAILGAAELPVAVTCSAFILREQVSGLQWIGVGITLFGVALPELARAMGRRRLRPSFGAWPDKMLTEKS